MVIPILRALFSALLDLFILSSLLLFLIGLIIITTTKYARKPMILVREIKEFVEMANSKRKNRLRTKSSKRDLLELLELIQD